MTAVNQEQVDTLHANIKLLRAKFESFAHADAVREQGVVRDVERAGEGYRSKSMDFAWRAVQACQVGLLEGAKLDLKLWSFDEFIEYGIERCIESGSSLTRGMPWSFTFHGHVVTHENDSLFLIGADGLKFARGDLLAVVTCGERDDLTVIECHSLKLCKPAETVENRPKPPQTA